MLSRLGMSGTPGAIVRRGGISRTVFVVSLVLVAAISGASGYFIQGILHPAPSAITLVGAGSSFVNPLITAINANYSKINANVQINYQSIGSGAGINALGQKTVDFGASDAPLTTSQTSSVSNALTIPDTIGAVVIAYNIPINSTYSIHKVYISTLQWLPESFRAISSPGTIQRSSRSIRTVCLPESACPAAPSLWFTDLTLQELPSSSQVTSATVLCGEA